MGKDKDIDGFLKDAKRASKVLASHIPIARDALSVHDMYEVTRRLRKSAPKAARAVKNDVRKRIRRQGRRLKRKLRLK